MARKTYATHVTLPTGKRIYIRGKTREELNQKVLKAKMEIGMGVNIADSTKFSDYAYAWARAYKAPPRLRPNSYATLLGNLERHVIPYFGDMLVRDIKPIHVQGFLSSISSYSKSLQLKCYQILNAILRTAEDNGIIARNPIRKEDRIVGKAVEEEEALTNDQAKALLKAVSGTRAYLFCLIALSTGMRRGEILGLMWEDVDLENGFITVTHNKAFLPDKNDAPVTQLLKTDAAHRRLPLSPALVEALREEQKLSPSTPYVLSMGNGESLSKSSFRKLWDIVSVRTATESRPLGSAISGGRAGPITVSLDFNCHPHLLRHTFITQLFEQGLDLKQVQYLAGHSTPEMTLRVYTHYRRKVREAETSNQVRSAVAHLTA